MDKNLQIKKQIVIDTTSRPLTRTVLSCLSVCDSEPSTVPLAFRYNRCVVCTFAPLRWAPVRPQHRQELQEGVALENQKTFSVQTCSNCGEKISDRCTPEYQSYICNFRTPLYTHYRWYTLKSPCGGGACRESQSRAQQIV